MIELVIFDNDGVLVDSEPIACDVLAGLLSDLGLPTSYEDVLEEYLGGSTGRTRTLAEAKLGRRLPPTFEDIFHERLFDRLGRELRPVKGADKVLDRIACTVCVASSGTPERVMRSLGITGLTDYFGDRIFSATQVQTGKPAPDLFLFAATTIGIAPERCVVIEDSPLGVSAGNAAGMRTVGFAGLTPTHRLHHATAGVVRSMEELLPVLDQLGVPQADRAGRSVNRGV